MRYLKDSAHSRLFPEDDKLRKKANTFVNRLSEKTINWLYDTFAVDRNKNATLEEKKDFVYFAKYNNLKNNTKKFEVPKDPEFEKLRKYYKKIYGDQLLREPGVSFTVTEKQK